MKIEVKPTQDPEKLRENLEKRVENAEVTEEGLEVTLEDEKLEILDRTPGIDHYVREGEKIEGLKGRPVQEEATAELETREDLARAALATIEGYDLVILQPGDQWSLKLLRRLNPGVVELKQDEAPEFLDIEKTLRSEGLREEIGMDLDQEEVEKVVGFLQE
jgi:hypothetical protein